MKPNKMKSIMMNAIVEVQLDEYTNEYFIEIPPDMLESTGLQEGDTIVWEKIDKDSWSIRKKCE